jgi:hypothetical protein
MTSEDGGVWAAQREKVPMVSTMVGPGAAIQPAAGLGQGTHARPRPTSLSHEHTNHRTRLSKAACFYKVLPGPEQLVVPGVREEAELGSESRCFW